MIAAYLPDNRPTCSFAQINDKFMADGKAPIGRAYQGQYKMTSLAGSLPSGHDPVSVYRSTHPKVHRQAEQRRAVVRTAKPKGH